MKILVLGSGGIIAQHMRLTVPMTEHTTHWWRLGSDPLSMSVDLCDEVERTEWLYDLKPDVIVNLAGNNDVDAVEKDPDASYEINCIVPGRLADWCDKNDSHLVQVSSQAVFSGEDPPYGPLSGTSPVNRYGQQKLSAERAVRWNHHNWSIVRSTFVIGVRPMPFAGRRNPMEAALEDAEQFSVKDRFFSIVSGRKVARYLWWAAISRIAGSIHHVPCDGHGFTRSMLSKWVSGNRATATKIYSVGSGFYAGLAPRPIDTTFNADAEDTSAENLKAELMYQAAELYVRDSFEPSKINREIALFLGINEELVLSRMSEGFGALHGDVAEDFRKANPQNDGELLYWYKTTEAYIWELAAYHCDAGFNYLGMCKGIIEHITAGLPADAPKIRCLNLGDGIGTLTLKMLEHGGIDPVYHDLYGSRTAHFAHFRTWLRTGRYLHGAETVTWEPGFAPQSFDVVTSLDFLEHVTDVESWVAAIWLALKPGGAFLAQNAFAIGSGANGSIPCHLERNDRFEKDWTPLMHHTGFQQIGTTNWWRKPGAEKSISA